MFQWSHITLPFLCWGGSLFTSNSTYVLCQRNEKNSRDFLRFPTCRIPNQPWDVDRREGAFGIVDYVKSKGAERIVLCEIATISLSMWWFFVFFLHVMTCLWLPSLLYQSCLGESYGSLLGARATACSSNLALVQKHRPMEMGKFFVSQEGN